MLTPVSLTLNSAIVFAVSAVLFCECKDLVSLTILHTNDVHARIDPVNSVGGACQNKDFRGCFGGLARQLTLVNRIKSETRNTTLFLNAGDYFQGTLWYKMLKGEFLADAVNLLNHDAMAIGNHEFDDGSEGLAKFLSKAKSPVVACNLDVSKDLLLKRFNIKPSVIVNAGRHKLGIIGYLTPDTKFLSNPSNETVFTDELDCMQKEARMLRKKGIKIIIGLGHSGYSRDIELAKKIPEISVMVGGHSHTMLSSLEIDSDKPKGTYPTVVNRPDGTKCLVVQAFWMGKYLGHIRVSFDDEGRAISWNGAPILLDDKVPTDQTMENFLIPHRRYLDRISNRVIGRTSVLLDNKECSFKECNVGNFVTDGIVNYFVEQNSNAWGLVSAALINGNGLRTSLTEGQITFSDLSMLQPFENKIVILNVTGSELRNMFEQAANKYDLNQLKPSLFYQMSGIKVMLNMLAPPGPERIASLKIRCRKCRSPSYEHVDENSYYQIAIQDFLVKGGDQLDLSFVDSRRIIYTGIVDINITEHYTTKMSPIWHETNDRLIILKDQTKENLCFS